MESWNPISAQLRAARTRAGISLSQLARRVGTSAATLSRYEGGWGRFELYTLRKIASAVGCRLAVRFEPVGRSGRRESRAKTIRRLSRLFWDRPLDEKELTRYPKWVVERVVEYGDLHDLRALIDELGREAFLNTVRQANWQSPKTRAFWEAMLKEEDYPCTKNACRRRAGNFWTEWRR
jgi:transcriptional regulator with XRE-family HTH domain